MSVFQNPKPSLPSYAKGLSCWDRASACKRALIIGGVWCSCVCSAPALLCFRLAVILRIAQGEWLGVGTAPAAAPFSPQPGRGGGLKCRRTCARPSDRAHAGAARLPCKGKLGMINLALLLI